MKQTRLAPLVAVAGSVLVLVGLALPYAFETAAGVTVALYYNSGTVNPLVAGLFASVVLIVAAAGREERTDPLVAAGVTLALGAFIALIAALWALTVPADVSVGVAESTLGKQHRWGLLLVALAIPAGGAFWARSLGVL